MSEAYFAQMLPYAQRASDKTSIPVSVVLAQWSYESDFGRSSLAKRANNHGGIKYNQYSIAEGPTGELRYAAYKDFNQFADDYIRVMNLPRYKPVREAKTIEEAIVALGKSGYAESAYTDGGAGVGGNVINRLRKYNLTKYDSAQPQVSRGGLQMSFPAIPKSTVQRSPDGWTITGAAGAGNGVAAIMMMVAGFILAVKVITGAVADD